MDERPNVPVQAVERTIELLERLCELNGAGVAELANTLDASDSTIHNHLQTLHQRGYVTKDDNARYHVGLPWLRMGGAARNKNKLYHVAKPAVDELAQETEELAILTVEYRNSPIYLYQSWGEKAVSTDSYIGINLPLHCTATGKATLAHLPVDRARQIIEEHPLPKETSNTLTDTDELLNELSQIRENGVAYDDEERIKGMRGVAVPIHIEDKKEILGTIGVTGPVSRLPEERFREDIPEYIMRLAQMIEVDATYS